MRLRPSRLLSVRAAIAGGAIALVLSSAGGTSAVEKLSLTATPTFSNAPSTVVVRAMVARHADNRMLQIGADSGDFYRSSHIQLDGTRAPILTEIRLSNMPSGEYVVFAVLSDEMGQQTTVRQTVTILSRDGSMLERPARP